MGSDAKLLSRQIFPAESTCIMAGGGEKKRKKEIYKQALKVFLLLSCPSASGFFPFLIQHKECIVSRAITSSLHYTGQHMAQGRKL